MTNSKQDSNLSARGWIDRAEDVFLHMRTKGLIKRTVAQKETVRGLSPKKILDIGQELAHMTELPDGNLSAIEMGHCASVSLAGGRETCAEIGCRLDRLQSLGQFAAFYSDRVYMRNPFSGYAHLTSNIPDDMLRSIFFDDIQVATSLKPLLQHGVVRFVSDIDHFCPSCLAKHIGMGSGGGSKLSKQAKRLGRDYLANTEYELLKLGSSYHIRKSGPDRLYEHGGSGLIFNQLPRAIVTRPRVVRKLETEGRVLLSKTLIRELDFHNRSAGETVHSVVYHLLVNNSLGTSLVTERQLHIDFLEHISIDNSREKRNAIAQKYLTTIVPFLDDVPIRDLLTVRKREQESFTQFRAKLNAAIDEFRSSGTAFTAKSAHDIYHDILAPQLSRLDKRVSKAKRDLISTTARSVGGTVGAISFGLLTGLIGPEVAAIAKAVGVVGCGSNMIKKVLALGDAKKNIEEDDLYFLWQVKRKAKKP